MKINKIIIALGMMVTLWLVVPVVAQAVTFNRTVYVQNPMPNSMDLRWVTTGGEILTVNYGLTTSYGSQVTADSATHARVTGLTPGTQYFYQLVYSGTAVTPAGDTSYFFKTAPVVGSTQPFKWAFWGDSGDGSTNQTGVRDQVIANHPDLTFVAGDVIYNGSDKATYDVGMETKYFGVYKNAMKYTPFYVTCGNHDSYDCPGLIDAHTFPNNGRAAGSNLVSTYAFDYGNVHYTTINSEFDMTFNASNPAASAPQMAWAYDNIKNNPQPWKILILHYNAWSSGSHSTNTTVVNNVAKMAQQAGASIMMWGHSHVYERFSQYQGVYYFTVGNGGKGQAASACGPYTNGPSCIVASGRPSSVENYGFLLAEVNGNNMTMKFIGKSGAVEDSVTYTTGGAPTATPGPSSTPTRTPTPIPNPPAPIMNAPTVSCGHVNLSWSQSTGAVSYHLYKCIGTSCNPALTVQVAPFPVVTPNLTYVDTAVVGGTAYRYAVEAENINGLFSAFSNTVTATPPVCPTNTLAPTPTSAPIATVTPTPIPGTCGQIGAGQVITTATLPTGNYNVWSRIRSNTSTSKTYMLHVTDPLSDKCVDANPTGLTVLGWTWVKVPMFINGSNQTITMIGKDSGLKLDKIVFTQDLACVPNDANNYGDNCLAGPTPTVVIGPSATPVVISPTPSRVPTVTPTPIGNSLTLQPLADARVLDYPNPTDNHGLDTNLRVNDITSGSYHEVSRSFIKFDMSGFNSSFVSAKLRIKTASASSAGSSEVMKIKRAPDNSWGETTINWNNQPSMINSGSVSFVQPNPNTTFEIDITTMVRAAKTAGYGKITVALDCDGCSDGLTLDSRETSTGPKLIVSY